MTDVCADCRQTGRALLCQRCALDLHNAHVEHGISWAPACPHCPYEQPTRDTRADRRDRRR